MTLTDRLKPNQRSANVPEAAKSKPTAKKKRNYVLCWLMYLKSFAFGCGGYFETHRFTDFV